MSHPRQENLPNMANFFHVALHTFYWCQERVGLLHGEWRLFQTGNSYQCLLFIHVFSEVKTR